MRPERANREDGSVELFLQVAVNGTHKIALACLYRGETWLITVIAKLILVFVFVFGLVLIFIIVFVTGAFPRFGLVIFVT